MKSPDNLASSRFQTAMDLFAAGVSIMRLKLQRQNPSLTEAEVEELLAQWLRKRPGAERGDCPGTPRAV